MAIFAVFLILPLIEIALFVVVGGRLGVFGTLAAVIGTALAGLVILHRQGRTAGPRIRESLALAVDPATPLTAEALRAFGAILLIVPGFLTDALGLLLLLPPSRGALARFLAARIVARGAHAPRAAGIVIDGEFRDVTEQAQPPARRDRDATD